MGEVIPRGPLIPQMLSNIPQEWTPTPHLCRTFPVLLLRSVIPANPFISGKPGRLGILSTCDMPPADHSLCSSLHSGRLMMRNMLMGDEQIITILGSFSKNYSHLRQRSDLIETSWFCSLCLPRLERIAHLPTREARWGHSLRQKKAAKDFMQGFISRPCFSPLLSWM